MGFGRIIFDIFKRVLYKIDVIYSWAITWIKFKVYNVSFYNDFTAFGRPVINVDASGSFSIGRKLKLNSGKHYNIIGRQQPCYFIVGPGAKLIIGNNAGISSSAIICHNKIIIGDNVKIGGNNAIYDTDFHSLDSSHRNSAPEDFTFVKTKPVIIENNVFLGAHSIILKGVTIGENSIVGANSVVTKDIPKNQIWAGNPAKFIKSLT